MAVDPPAFDELMTAFRGEAESRDPELTDWADGSVLDAIAGAAAVLTDEQIRAVIDAFAAHYVDTATGDDLRALLLDRFGIASSTFDASAAVVTVTFTTTQNYVEIPAGTRVSGEVDGEDIAFTTDAAASVTSPDTTVDVVCTCTTTGTVGNVTAGVLDTVNDGAGVPLDASISVTNAARAVGGSDDWSDARIRAYARGYFGTLRRATTAALQQGATSVPGVYFATVDESEMGPDDGAHVVIYIGDVDGRSNDALEDLVAAEIDDWRAAGVKVDIEGMIRDVKEVWIKVGVPTALTNRVDLLESIRAAVVAYADTVEAGESIYSSQIERATLDQDDRIVYATAYIEPLYTAFDAITPAGPEYALRLTMSSITVIFEDA